MCSSPTTSRTAARCIRESIHPGLILIPAQQAEISKIERGEVIPKISTIDRLLAPLGLRLAVIEDHEPAVA